jgi:hypothetical protein
MSMQDDSSRADSSPAHVAPPERFKGAAQSPASNARRLYGASEVAYSAQSRSRSQTAAVRIATVPSD